MKLAVFGVSGFLGRVLCAAALENGHEVRALVRTPEKIGDLLGSIESVRGDYYDAQSIDKTIMGCEAVMSTVGPPLGRSADVVTGKHVAAMDHLVDAIRSASISRIVTVAGAGCTLPGEKPPLKRRVMRRVLRVVSGANYVEKEAEHAILAASDLDWVIVRPPMIAAAVSGVTHVHSSHLASFKVDVRQLADFMLESLTQPTWLRQAPLISTGGKPPSRVSLPLPS